MEVVETSEETLTSSRSSSFEDFVNFNCNGDFEDFVDFNCNGDFGRNPVIFTPSNKNPMARGDSMGRGGTARRWPWLSYDDWKDILIDSTYHTPVHKINGF